MAGDNMEMFWNCSDCGSPNPYPDSKECGVCGKEIDQQEITAAEANYRTAVKNEEKEKEAQRLEALKRQKREATLKRRAELKAEMQRRQEEQKKKELQKAEEQRKKLDAFNKANNSINTFSQSFYKILCGLKKFLRIAIVICILVVLVSVIANGSAESVIENIGNTLETKIEFIAKRHFDPFTPFENIADRFEVFKNHFENSKNINSLFEMLGW